MREVWKIMFGVAGGIVGVGVGILILVAAVSIAFILGFWMYVKMHPEPEKEEPPRTYEYTGYPSNLRTAGYTARETSNPYGFREGQRYSAKNDDGWRTDFVFRNGKWLAWRLVSPSGGRFYGWNG